MSKGQPASARQPWQPFTPTSHKNGPMFHRVYWSQNMGKRSSDSDARWKQNRRRLIAMLAYRIENEYHPDAVWANQEALVQPCAQPTTSREALGLGALSLMWEHR